MKKTLLVSLLVAASLSVTAQNVPSQRLGVNFEKSAKVELRADDDDDYVPADLPCPSNSVKTGEFDENKGGFQTSDEGRPDLYCKFYQSFSECFWKVKSIRVVVTFASYADSEGWNACSNRNIFKEGTDEIEKPLKMQLSFYKDNGGQPGEMIVQKIQDVMGVNTGFSMNSYPYGKLYTYTLELDEPIALQEGWFSVSAYDDGSKPTCWLALLTNSDIPGMGLIKIKDYETGQDGWMRAFSPACYCMMGDGSMIAKKALQLKRFVNPNVDGTSSHEKIQVEIRNVGSENYSNPILQLWVDDKMVCEETVDITLKSMERYKHTFSKMVDLSNGKHSVKVKNVTGGDELICSSYIESAFEDFVNGRRCVSKAETPGYAYIKKVTCGDINNASKYSDYSDFTNLKTDIKPGQTLEVSCEVDGYYGKYVTVFVDWNNNGVFDDEGEFMGYIGKEPLKIRIPSGVQIGEGERTMRIIFSNLTSPSPCGVYEYGETEDYTLVVKRSDNTPFAVEGTNPMVLGFKGEAQKEGSFSIENIGNAELSADISVKYFLPNMPFSSNSMRSCNSKEDALDMNHPLVLKGGLRAGEPASVGDFAYVLNYDKGSASAISGGGAKQYYYAQYYPASMLADISGLKIASIDVYCYDAPKTASIVLFKGLNQTTTVSEPLYEKAFTAKAHSWNRIVFDEPIAIPNHDLWVGFKVAEMEEGKFYQGIDRGPGINGYGAMLSVDGENWIALPDAGLNANFCIRTNLQGEKPAAVSWMTLSESKFKVSAADKKDIKVSADVKGLNAPIYEALLMIKTNDPLNGMIEVPVYLYTQAAESAEAVSTSEATIKLLPEDGKMEVRSQQKIRRVDMVSMTGKIVKQSLYDANDISFYFRSIEKGVYILVIYYEDGKVESVKFTW